MEFTKDMPEQFGQVWQTTFSYCRWSLPNGCPIMLHESVDARKTYQHHGESPFIAPKRGQEGVHQPPRLGVQVEVPFDLLALAVGGLWL